MRLERTTAETIIETESEAETEAVGRALATVLGPDCVIGLIGPLGAGKTRFVRAIAEAVGVDPREIGSPTFVLIHEYEGSLTIYHFDAYRLKTADDFDDLGAADYWSAGGVCLVEWADRVRDRLPGDTWWVNITPTGPRSRQMRFSGRPEWETRLEAELSAQNS